MRKRNRSLHLRLTEKELQDLKQKAERAGVNVQTYFIWLLYNHPIREVPPIEYQEVLRELRKINNSMNRIAAKVEETNAIDSTAYRKNVDKLQKTVGTLMEAVYS